MTHVACHLLSPGHIDMQLIGRALVLCSKVRPLQAKQMSQLPNANASQQALPDS